MAIRGISRGDFIASLRLLGSNGHFVLSLLSVVIGLAAGLAAVVFRYAIDVVQRISFGFGGERVASLAAELPWWQVLIAPALGGLVVGLFVYRFLPGRRPHGVAQVIEANALKGGRMSLPVGLNAALASAVSIGAGASVGREGPVVHLGASIGAWLAERLQLGRGQSRMLLGCGVAAAVACSFNAPIAGTFFALEVVVGHYALSAFAPIVIASVTGTLISRAVYGDFPAFILPHNWVIASVWEFPAFALLGLVSAVAAMIFIRSIMFTERVFQKIPVPGWSRPALGGLAVGAIAVAFPQVLGVGYEATDAALSETYALGLLLALIALKTAATAISLGSGFAGGVFSPSLFIGAMVGGAFGIIATSAFPDLSSGHGAYTMIGMGAVAGAVLGAPISTILMIFELTKDYELTVALMIATVIASLVTQQILGHSFFTLLLAQRGLSVKGGRDVGLVQEIRVASVLDRRFETVATETPLSDVRERLREAPWGLLLVVNDDGRLAGTLTYADLLEAAFDTSHDEELSAGSMARTHPEVLQVDDHLEAAVEIYAHASEPHLPVVDNKDAMHLLGIAHQHEVMLAYNRALDRARGEERGEL